MAKFHGRVGYNAAQVETSPGIWEDTIVERIYSGDVIRNSRGFREGENLNNDLSVGNSISIVADAYASLHFFAMRYVEWSGVLWTVVNVDVQRPRLVLQLGEVYHGPTPVGTP